MIILYLSGSIASAWLTITDFVAKPKAKHFPHARTLEDSRNADERERL